MAIQKEERLLRENGFRYERKCRHGSFWTDNYGSRMLLSRPGSNGDPRGQRNFTRDLQRAVDKRPKPAAIVAKEDSVMFDKPIPNNWIPVTKKPEPLKIPLGSIAPIKLKRGARLAGSTKYTKEKREEIRGLILDCRKENKSIMETVGILSSLGIKTPNDRMPDRAFVMNQLSNMRKAEINVDFVDEVPKKEAKEIKPTIVVAPKPEPVKIVVQSDELRQQIRSVMAWKISDAKKLGMIAALMAE